VGFLGLTTMFRRLKDRWVSRICTSIPFDVWQTIGGVDLVIPYWHVVCDHDLPHVSELYRFRSIRQFEADVDFFLRHYSPVTEQEVIRHLHDGSALPRRSVLFTFDDGFREIHEVIAPILRTKGASASFFLITSAIDNQHLCYPQKKSLVIGALARGWSGTALDEVARLLSSAGVPNDSSVVSRIRGVSYRQRDVLDDLGRILECDFQKYLASGRPYVTSQQVEDLLRQGFAIGAHSVDHPSYADLSLDEQLFQTGESMRWISERFHIECQSFAFPYRDNGVGPDFFRSMFSEGRLKVSFGTGGLVPHPFRYNLRRVLVGNTDLTAGETVVRRLARSVGPRLAATMRRQSTTWA